MKINKGIIVQKDGRGLTIFDGEKSTLYTLNETASFIFSRLKKTASVDQIAKIISKKYGIALDKAQEDCLEFLKELASKKIIKPD